MVLEAHAGLGGPQRAVEAPVDRVLGEQAAGERLRVGPGGLEVADRPALHDRLLQRRVVHRLAGLLRVVLQVEQPDPDAGQQGVHAALHDQGQQRAPKHEPVEAAHDGRDSGPISRYERLHDGVRLGTGIGFHHLRTPGSDAVATLGCGRQPAL